MTHAASTGSRRTVAIIPVRGLEGAKSRLGEVLDAEERRDLVEQLLRATVSAARSTPGVTEVVVISPDPEALGVAVASGARSVTQRSRGLNPAIVEARAAVPPGARMLVLPADLAALTSDALQALIDAADTARPPCVVIAPDRHGRGTNALLLDPPDVVDPAFGGDSLAAHAWLAAAAGAACVEVAGELGLDLDTPDDLLLAGEPASGPAARLGPEPSRERTTS